VTASIFYLKIEDNIFVISIVYNNMDAEKNQVEKSIKCNTCREVRSSKYFCWRGTQYYPKCKYCMRDARLRQCNKCLEVKSWNRFEWNRDVMRNACKDCRNTAQRELRRTAEYQKRFTETGQRDARNEYGKSYRNDSENVEKRSKYYEEHKEEIKVQHKIYVEKNREKINERLRTYRESNREIIRAKKREYEKNRRKIDIGFKIKMNLRNRIYCALQNKTTKSARTLELLGCTVEFFRYWLEFQFDENMTWENYGSYWHMDHVKPCELFDMTEEEEQKLCFHWTNIQPLEGNENKSKGISYNETIKNNHQYVLKEFCEENGIDMTMIIDTLCYI
jgi:hypothetical protein